MPKKWGQQSSQIRLRHRALHLWNSSACSGCCCSTSSGLFQGSTIHDNMHMNSIVGRVDIRLTRIYDLKREAAILLLFFRASMMAHRAGPCLPTQLEEGFQLASNERRKPLHESSHLEDEWKAGSTAERGNHGDEGEQRCPWDWKLMISSSIPVAYPYIRQALTLFSFIWCPLAIITSEAGS